MSLIAPQLMSGNSPQRDWNAHECRAEIASIQRDASIAKTATSRRDKGRVTCRQLELQTKPPARGIADAA